MAYSNGQIPASALTSITGVSGARLRPGAAAAWERLRAAVHTAHGWYPAPTGPTDAYRPYATQESLFRARYTTTYLAGRPSKRWNAATWYLRAGMAAAAVPGTSNHGLGITVDITGLGSLGVFTTTHYKQLAAIATTLGWSNAEGRSIGEPWHWTYTGAAELTSSGGTTTGTVTDVPTLTAPTPITPLAQEDDMRIIAQQTRGTWLIGAGFAHKLTTEEWAQLSIQEHGHPVVRFADGAVGERVFDLTKAAYTQNNA